MVLMFILVFGLTLISAFAPPTWMALALVGFEFPDTGAVHLVMVGVVAATLKTCPALLRGVAMPQNLQSGR